MGNLSLQWEKQLKNGILTLKFLILPPQQRPPPHLEAAAGALHGPTSHKGTITQTSGSFQVGVCFSCTPGCDEQVPTWLDANGVQKDCTSQFSSHPSAVAPFGLGVQP